MSEEIWEELFAISSDIRYVALRIGDDLKLKQRPAIAQASSSESDRYEELLVNPTLLTLAEQRGRIDCGGLEFLVIRYGAFFQLLHAVKGGHVSIAVEPTGDPLGLVGRVRGILRARGLWPVA